MSTEIFLYNLDNAKGRMIEALCSRQGIAYRHVPVADYLERIGYVCGIEGFSRIDIPFTGVPFTDEMILMKGFDNTSLQNFLVAYRDEGISSVMLKAGLTPTNVHWNSLQLHDELAHEYETFRRM